MSTSPSYILMASLEMAVADLAERGKALWDGTLSLAADLRERINNIPGLSCPDKELTGKHSVIDRDPTRADCES